MPSKRSIKKRLENLEDGTTDYKQGNLATWIAAMETDTAGGIVDEEKRLYRYGGQLYQLPKEIVEIAARRSEELENYEPVRGTLE
ncbi:hypothetical protein [Haladaptatus salinisoli]|uniref:hypothetical protein n=1 Tax=Haladaptatus salinisoli TaxID=2884876 RepID=UPI001D0B98E6|nr:hypothetical protein [Haladaptatus salinisoli]